MSSVKQRSAPAAKARRALMLGALLLSSVSQAGPLSMQQAEALALREDPSVLSIEAGSQALTEMAVAAGQLPDPLLRLGMVSLPVDSFELGQEPMTQLQVGLVQRFPRGQSRSLQEAQVRQSARALDEHARDRRLQITRTVRQQFLEVLLQEKLIALTEQARIIFADLAEITTDYYASGRAQQQDVLRAAVELSRIEDRLARFSQGEQAQRAQLGAFITDAAYGDFTADWPQMPPLMPVQALREGLVKHPRIQALQQNVQVAETAVELAEQRYKPEFALDVRYGGRAGTNPDGSSRSDLLSVMLTMDLPLFHDKRQDRVSAARIAESSAAMFNRDDVLRKLDSAAAMFYADLQRQGERLELYETTLLPQAKFSAEASFEAWQSSVGDLTTLMRARITEYELQLEHARLQAGERQTRAQLLYLQGDTS